MRPRIAIVLTMAILVCGGCSKPRSGPLEDPIRTTIAGVDLRDRSFRSADQISLYDQVERLIGEGRERTARLIVAARPDEARRCILERKVAEPAVLLMAAVLDRMNSGGDPNRNGWTAYVRHRTSSPDTYRSWDEDLDEVGRCIREGRWDAAADVLPLEPPRAPGGDLLAIEAARIAAVILMANNRLPEARSSVLEAMPLNRVYPTEGADLVLLLSECERRQSGVDSHASWMRAAMAGVQPTAINDPDWLRRLMEARPAAAPYPDAFATEIRHRVGSVFGPPIATIPIDCAIKAWIGTLLLGRGEPDMSLLYWSQAVDACPDPVIAIPLRVGQIRSLAQLRRYSDAQGILDAISGSPASWEALLKGMSLVLAIKRGEIPTRVDAAIPPASALQGSILLRAVADRASALHVAGQTEDALRLLNQLKIAGNAQGDDLFVSQCLQVEVVWTSTLGDDKRVDAARQQVDAWESSQNP